MQNTSKYILAVATFSGTVIGVGIFSLPYIATKVGMWVMLAYLLVLTGLVILIHLIFSEVALQTPDFLRLPGYSKIYLGNWGRAVALIATILGYIGTLLAYIIIGGVFLANLLVPILGGNIFLYILLYWILGAVFILWGINAVSRIEFWGLVLFFISLIVIFWKGFSFLHLGNLPIQMSDISNWFLPYGPILFALWGATMIPEVEEMLGEDKKKTKKVVLVATIIPAICYLLFILFVVAISGAGTTLEAITGLQGLLGKNVMSLMFFAGFLATFTSFIAVGLTLKKVFWYDLTMPHYFSWVLTCSVPLLLYLLGFQDFIKTIGLVGGVGIAIEGILILLIYDKIKKNKSRFLIYPLILIFLAGIIYEILYFIK
ncbi:MAG: aromatic amino acid transport family protein [Candidatus Staskawiczbacteria bacterium]|jgi:amino acid permease